MFNFMKIKKSELVSPVTGKCVALSEVPDKMLGGGVAHLKH